MIKLRVFVSSVQKELATERHAVKTLIASDPFLDEHFVPILFEDEPSKLKAHQAVPVFEVQPSVVESLTQNQRIVLQKLLKQDQVQVAELAPALGVSAQAVRKDLAKLQTLSLVEKRGAARATYYVLKERNLFP